MATAAPAAPDPWVTVYSMLYQQNTVTATHQMLDMLQYATKPTATAYGPYTLQRLIQSFGTVEYLRKFLEGGYVELTPQAVAQLAATATRNGRPDLAQVLTTWVEAGVSKPVVRLPPTVVPELVPGRSRDDYYTIAQRSTIVPGPRRVAGWDKIDNILAVAVLSNENIAVAQKKQSGFEVNVYTVDGMFITRLAQPETSSIRLAATDDGNVWVSARWRDAPHEVVTLYNVATGETIVTYAIPENLISYGFGVDLTALPNNAVAVKVVTDDDAAALLVFDTTHPSGRILPISRMYGHTPSNNSIASIGNVVYLTNAKMIFEVNTMTGTVGILSTEKIIANGRLMAPYFLAASSATNLLFWGSHLLKYESRSILPKIVVADAVTGQSLAEISYEYSDPLIEAMLTVAPSGVLYMIRAGKLWAL